MENDLAKWKRYIKLLALALYDNKFIGSLECTVYRGIANHSANDYHVGKHFYWQSFMSTSMNWQVAYDFAEKNGVLFEIHCTNGKYINDYSHFKAEDEILLPLFSFFLVKEKKEVAGVQYVVLEQINENTSIFTKNIVSECMKVYPELNLPLTCEIDAIKQYAKVQANKVLVWVDDQPKNNAGQIAKCETQGITVITLRSTCEAFYFFQSNFHLFQLGNDKFRIISDNTREEPLGSGKFNKHAGLDLIKLLRVAPFSYKYPLMVFCGAKFEVPSSLGSVQVEIGSCESYVTFK